MTPRLIKVIELSNERAPPGKVGSVAAAMVYCAVPLVGKLIDGACTTKCRASLGPKLIGAPLPGMMVPLT